VVREATAPTASRTTGACVPALRAKVTRSFQCVRPAGARQVSTATEPRSSRWAPADLRLIRLSVLAQRPRLSQLDLRPSARRPRTSMVIQLRLVVVAFHEAI